MSFVLKKMIFEKQIALTCGKTAGGIMTSYCALLYVKISQNILSINIRFKLI